jgi:hypothetical protein
MDDINELKKDAERAFELGDKNLSLKIYRQIDALHNAPTNIDKAVDYGKHVLSNVRDIYAGIAKGATVIPHYVASKIVPETTTKVEDYATQKLLDLGVKPESLAFKVGNIAGETAGTLPVGRVLGGTVSAVTKLLTKGSEAAIKAEKLAAALKAQGALTTEPTILSNLAYNVPAAATIGGVSSVLANGSPQEVGVGASIGAVSPVVGSAIRGGTRVAQYVSDLRNPKMGEINASKIMQDVLGSKLNIAEMKNKLRNAPKDLSAAQAGYGIDRDTWQALGKAAENNDEESFYRLLKQAQENKLAKNLSSITPNLKNAEATRSAITSPMYKEGEQQVIPLNEANMALIERMRPTGAIAGAEKISQMQPGSPPLFRGDYIPAGEVQTSLVSPTGQPILRYQEGQYPEISGKSVASMAKALKDIQTGIPTAEAGKNYQVEAGNVRQEFLNQMEQAIPKFGEARKTFAELSVPVNQSRILQAIKGLYFKPEGTGVRNPQLLKMLDTGEEKFVGKATKYGKAGTLAENLTPEQMKSVDALKAYALRDINMANQAKAGAGGLGNIMDQDTYKFRLPSLLSRPATIGNAIMDRLEHKIGIATTKALVEGMKSGKNAVELLNTVPSKDRQVVMETLQTIFPSIARGGALTPASLNTQQ